MYYLITIFQGEDYSPCLYRSEIPKWRQELRSFVEIGENTSLFQIRLVKMNFLKTQKAAISDKMAMYAHNIYFYP